MKYGTAVHVALHNHDFRLAYKIAKSLLKTKDFDPVKDFNRADADGNTPLHLACRHCHVNIAKELLPCMVTVPSLAVPSGHRLSGSLGSLSGTPAA